MAKITSSEGCKRLDETLESCTLAEKDNVRRLVQYQLLKSSLQEPTEEDAIQDIPIRHHNDKLLEKRSAEVWNALEMLRSASGNKAKDHKDQGNSTQGWKLKQDTDQYRVMYREGPKGTPFHTLLLEGYIDGPIDSCLCVGLESTLYPHWWPQFAIPTFKIIESRSLKTIRIGEEISLIRMKVPWPISMREIIFHYFELEYFEGDILIVLLDSIPSLEQLDESIHGFNFEGIPPMEGTIRMELVGGFALQKVSAKQSYFRSIANLDIKLDFVPPWLINFISRQLIGHGFKLYQKAVFAATNYDESFRKIIDHGPMYIRVRAGLQYNEEMKQEKKSCHCSIGELREGEEIEECITEGTAASRDFSNLATSNRASTSAQSTQSNETEKDGHDADTALPTQRMDFPARDGIEEHHIQETVGYIDPQTQRALKVLDNVIAFVQTHSPRVTSTSMNRSPDPVTTSESQLSNGDSRGWSNSLQDQFYKGVTETPFPPGGKVSQKLDKIGRPDKVTRNYHIDKINKSLSNEVHPIENHAPNLVKDLKLKSKQVSCFRFLCCSKRKS